MDKISLPIKTHFEEAEKINDEFTRARCRVMALGKNVNGSFFSREAVEDAMQTFKYVPIIGHVYMGDDGKLHIAGHEMKLVEDDNGYRWQTKCVPYGVCIGENIGFEDVTEEDGTVATYLCSDVILWTGKYPDIVEASYEDGSTWQSMEIKPIEVREYQYDKRYTEIIKFSASSLCMLGKSDDPKYNVTPCFPSASIIPYSADEHFDALFEEMKCALTECFANKSQKCEEGGSVEVENENLIENVEEPTVFEENQEQQTEPVVEEIQPEETAENFEAEENKTVAEETPEEEHFSSTYNKKREMLCNAVHALNEHNSSVYKWNYLVDFDDEYVYVNRETYCADGESEDHKIIRISYTINENSKEVSLSAEETEMFMKLLTAEESAEIDRMRGEFEAYKESHSVANDEVEELRSFKAERLAEDHKAEVQSVLEQFEDLEGNSDFELLKQNALNIDDMEVLADKCYAIRGKCAKVAPKVKNKEVKTPIVKFSNDGEDEPYGGLFSMFGNKN